MNQPTTIQERAATFDNLAKLVKSAESQKLYSDTAQVLRAMEAGYGELFAAALKAIQDNDLEALRAHVDKVTAYAQKLAQNPARQ